MEIRIEKYNSGLKKEWDDFVDSSKNGTFLFHRDFMEYHSDRFSDFSLLFYQKGKVVALLPANISNDVLYSHQGLTYGGLLLGEFVSVKTVINIFEGLKGYLQKLGVAKVIYKTVPYIYHKLPSEEDLYVLFRANAKLIGRSISSCVFQQSRVKYSELRRRGIKKAEKTALSIKEAICFEEFWRILEENLRSKFETSPVHSLSEIECLRSRFPDNIHLFEVLKNDCVVGGCVMFDTGQVAHVQYISANKEGKDSGALDYLFDYLIQNRFANKLYFDFGISTEKNGMFLNEGLISQKEGFGGRGVVYDIYQLELEYIDGL